MNQQRRKQLQQAVENLNSILLDIEQLKDEEQEYFDNMPESLQGGDKGQAAETAISNMEEAVTFIEEAISQLEESQNSN